MGYSFQVVPFEDFKRLSSELTRLAVPIERYQALRLGACCILLAETSKQCLGGISEEKRRLAIWVRNQRSTVRYVRYKGASKMRGALNADISNASDATKSKLDWLRDAAEYALGQSDARMKECLKYVSLEEATAYKDTFRNELNTRASAENAKKALIGTIVAGFVTIFIIPPIGILLLIAALLIFVGNKEKWERLKKAESDRLTQMSDLQRSLAELKDFDEQLEKPVETKSDHNQDASITAISADLESNFTYLDVACRELGSKALTWRELAQELYSQTNQFNHIGENTDVDPKEAESDCATGLAGALTKEGENATNNRQPNLSESSTPEIITSDLITKDVDDYYFMIDIDIARQVMQALGYKKMPSEWGTISIKTEERISRYLAERAGIKYEDFFWSFDEGNVRAEAL